MVFGGEGLRVGIRHDSDVSATGMGKSNPDRELRRLRRMELLEMLVDQIEENDAQAERIDELEDLSARLKQKLNQKDDQIERLKAKLDEKDALIRDLYLGKGDTDIDRLYISQNVAGMGDIATIPSQWVSSVPVMDFEGLDTLPALTFDDAPNPHLTTEALTESATNEAAIAVTDLDAYADSLHATTSAASAISPLPMSQGESERTTGNRGDNVLKTDAAAWLDGDDPTDPRSVWILRRP